MKGTRRYAPNYGTGFDRTSHHGTSCNYASIAEPHPFENRDFCTDPTSISDMDAAFVRRLFGGTQTTAKLMIAVGNIYIWAKHVAIADLNQSAGINHQVSIEII